MGEFFKGWRRKTGIATLILASALASAWQRSLSKCDRVDGLILAKLVHGYLVSTNGQINIIRRFPLPPDHAINSLHLKKLVSWRSEWADPVNTVLLGRTAYTREPGAPDCWSEFSVNWRFDFADFHLGEGRHHSWVAWNVQLWSIPYWSLVIPLTVLSSVLLLWPSRRKSKSQPSTAAPSRRSSFDKPC